MVKSLVYSIMKLTWNEQYVKELLEKSIEDGLMSQCSRYVTFSLTNSSETYIEQLTNLFREDESSATELLSYLIPWFCQKYMNTLEVKDYSDSNQLTDFHDKSILWFYNILRGKAHKIEKSFNEEEIRVVREKEYSSLLNKCEELEKNVILLKQQVKLEREIQMKLQNIKQKWEKVEKLLQSDFSLKKRLSIVDKSVVIFLGNDKQTERQKEIIAHYQLKDLRLYSSLDSLKTAFDYETADYIIFSTSQAKHSVYYQVKNKYGDKVFHSSKSNLDAILDEFTDYLVREGKANV
jgi:hypothetical protein